MLFPVRRQMLRTYAIDTLKIRDRQMVALSPF